MKHSFAWAGLKVAVVVASRSRPAELGVLLDRLERQTLVPAVIVLSVNAPSDLPPGAEARARIVCGGDGLTAQRNLGLAELKAGECDVIALLDDDYVPAATAIAGMARLFAENPDVVGANGVLLADGAVTGQLSMEQVDALLGEHAHGDPWVRAHTVNRGFYGCNMAFRTSAIHGLAFDEKLPLYGWQEDFDFASQVSLRGRLVKTSHFVGIHRGVRGGRVSGLKLGYSQIANPIYLMRKGTMSARRALPMMLKQLIANHAKAIIGDSEVDRAGRARGNRWALKHLLHAELDPLFVVRLETCHVGGGLDREPHAPSPLMDVADNADRWAVAGA